MNDAFVRIVVAHWRLLVVTFLIAVGGAFYLTGSQPARFVSTVRIESTTTAFGSDTEADSALNRVSGIATSRSVVQRALTAAKLTALDPDTVARDDVSVQRIGTSAVFDVTVTDRDAKTPASSWKTSVPSAASSRPRWKNSWWP